MNDPEVEVSIKASVISTANKVIIIINTKFDEILENPNTSHRTPTSRSSSVSPPLLIYFDLCSSSPHNIKELLKEKLVTHRRLCLDLASDISTAANDLGFGLNRFTLTIPVTITYQNVVVVLSDPPLPDEGLSLKVMRVILLGKMGREEIKSLKMETTKSCWICLDDLSSFSSSTKRGVATRMNCSHVFHGRCLLEWLQRKNTCPLDQTVLYDL
ncbi:hypothetical protein Bca4012_026881 [Brassica carinata]